MDIYSESEVKEGPMVISEEAFGMDNMSSNDFKETRLSDPNSCWNRFLRGLRCLWATKHTEDTKADRQLYIKTTIRELVIYMLFITILMIIAFGMTTVQAYWFTNLLNNLFTGQTFNENAGTFTSAQIDTDFWKFLSGPLINGLYWTTWYNNQKLPANQINFIFYENKLIGLPRMRQLRVSNTSCAIHEDFKTEIVQCFAPYSAISESRESYGLLNSTAWKYSSEDELKAGSYQGLVATYPGGGFYTDLGGTKNDTVNIITSLFDNLWIDRSTRAVIIDFTIYNANINLFCTIKLAVEFPPTGGLITSAKFRTVKLIRYVGPFDMFVLACELIFLVFIMYYIVEEVLEIKMLQFEYFFSFWNVLDILVILFSLVCSIFNVYRTATIQSVLQELIANDNKHPNFEDLSYWQLQFNYLIAITVFLAWVKIFKYISFNKTMTQLSETLNKCSKDLAGFALMFFIIFLAFAQLGYLIFGSQVQDFSRLDNSIYTLFRIILGDFDFAPLEMAHRILGPIYFVFYVFFVFFVLFNMFLAIINDTYSEVKEEMANQKNEFDIADYIKEKTEIILAKLHLKREKIIDMQKAMMNADVNKDGLMDFNEWQAEMISRGYGTAEIESVFVKYDLDGNMVLDQREQDEMQKELENLKNDLNNKIRNEKSENSLIGNTESKAASISMEEYRALSRRVERMDNNTRGIVSKIDAVLENLEDIEKSKANNRETMGMILNTLTSTDEFTEEVRKQKLELLIQSEINKLNQNSSSRPNSSIGSKHLDRNNKFE